MGNWSLVSVKTSDSHRDGQVFGTYMPVVFRLKYTPKRFGKFKEMPALQWNEVITVLDHKEGEYWVYVGDQYRRNISSPTFGTWTYRYSLAYASSASGRSYHETGAPSILMDNNGRQVPKSALPQANTSAKQADAVRNYLFQHGGMIDATVRDSPGVRTPEPNDGTNKERLLTFDCGLEGMGQRVHAWQYLRVNSNEPQSKWIRQFQWNNSSPGVKTTGLTRVPPPPNVSKVKTGGLHPGQYA